MNDNMSKIQDYYDFIDKFKGDLKPRLQTELEQLEDSLIAEEILPAISESVTPVLDILRRHLTLVVDYDPQAGIIVKTTRGEVVVKENTAKKYEIPKTHKVVKVAEAQPVEENEDEPQKSKKIKRSPKTGLCVWLPNGDFIQAKKANLTMAEAVKWAGVETVASLGFPHDGDYLVSKKEHPKYAGEQQSLPNGYLLNTHSSTKTKKQQLEKISIALNLGWKVEIVK
jgi:hypothetical protein